MKEKLKENISGYVLLASIFIASTIIALIKNISITTIMKDYQFSVLNYKPNTANNTQIV